MNRLNERIYKVAIYLRLSKDDGDLSFSSGKRESDSISNQRMLIMNYISSRPDLSVVDEYKDDGKTGTNFDRAEFQRMLADIYQKKIDCVIVKDLSRFGRDYIECGMYIENQFPELGVRFISINDNFDSANSSDTSGLLLPVTNLVNDTYSRDISVRVRSHLKTKREHGMFVSNYAPYGYKKDPEDKNHLIIDEYPANVVRDIFKWKIEGLSPGNIAVQLDKMGVLTPIQYKKSQGITYKKNSEKVQGEKWNHVTIRRMLRDEVYVGVLAQGKSTTPNYKTRKFKAKSPELWDRLENMHEPIVSQRVFDIVQVLLQEDTHATNSDGDIPVYSGRIFCQDCGAAMVRKTVKSSGKRYVYYVCSANKSDKFVCSSHSIRESKLDELTIPVLHKHIEAILSVEKAAKGFEKFAWEKHEIEKIDFLILSQEEIIKRNTLLKSGIYEDLQNGILDRDEYITIKEEMTGRIIAATEAIDELKRKKTSIQEGLTSNCDWLEQFKDFQTESKLTRKLIVNLLQKITVSENGEIKFTLFFADQVHDKVKFYEELEQRKQIIVLPKMEVS